jgi:hypothetical protein
LGQDFHPVSRRGETGRHEFRFSFLLDDTETASAKGNEPSVVAERGNADADQLSGLENRLAFLNLNLDFINLQLNHLVLHNPPIAPSPFPSPRWGEGGVRGHSSIIPNYSIALNWHAWIQDRQRMHFSTSMTAGVFFSHVTASVGHAFLQRPHILHFSGSTRNFMRLVQTRAGHRLS